MGGQGSGPRPGDRLRATYMTRGRRLRQQLQEQQEAEWQARQQAERDRLTAERIERQTVHARELGRESMRRRRARCKAAGIPVWSGIRKPEPRGASTPRVRRLRQRHRAERVAAEAAIREARRMERRADKGLGPVKSNAENIAAHRARKAAQRAEYLASQWFSPVLSEKDAKQLMQTQHPRLDELGLQTNYAWLLGWSQWVDATLNSNPPCIENKSQKRSLG